MDLLVAGLWIATGIVGAYMAGITLRAGSPDSPARETHLPPFVVFSHASAALLGLGVWLVYLQTGIGGTAWLAFGIVLVTASLGGFMMLRWMKDHRGSPDEVAERADRLAEQQIPSTAVHLHGGLATVTIVLVLLVASDLVG